MITSTGKHTAVFYSIGSVVPPLVSYLAQERVWVLQQPYKISSMEHELQTEIPQFFCFDGASVPRIFWSVMSPFDLSILAPMLHDWIYSKAGPDVRRVTADKVFKEVMRREGVPAWRRQMAYLAVRMFGKSSWKKK